MSMKSKRSEEYIDENIYDAAELVDKDGCGMAVVKRSDAYRAVEIAEEEMIEKALAAATMIFWERNNLKAGSVMKKKLPLFAQKLRDE